MKIALVVHDYHKTGGHSRYVAELAERFAGEHDVHVFANRFHGPLHEAIQYHHVPAWRISSLTTILSFLPLATLRLGGGFDIVHAQGASCWCPDVVTAHICLEGWFAAQAEHRGGLRWSQRVFRALGCRLERAIYQQRRSPRVIAVSERVRRDLMEYYRRTSGVTVIHHGVDLDRFHPRQRLRYRSSMRKALGFTETDVVALFVGDLQKGATTAMEAIARTENISLLLVSRSPLDPYRRRAARMGVSHRVVFAPPTDEIERIYAVADVFLFPTSYDAFGMVITEAMAMGLPVITSRAAGAAELIVHGQEGILVDRPTDAEQWARALRQLFDDASLRERLGRAARRKVESYTWDRVAEETMTVYRQALDEKRHRPVVAFLVNGTMASALGVRARAFADRLNDHYRVHLFYRSRRKIRSLLRFLVHLCRCRPRLVYVCDMGYSGVLAAALYKRLTGARLIVDTGDVITELARSMGTRGRLGLKLTEWLERLSLSVADHLVVRGTRHQAWLRAQGIDRVEVIPDGVDTDHFRPLDVAELRRQYDLDDVLTVGLVGTLTWNERWDMGYGWELVEALRWLEDEPVKGILIGDGSGLSRLQARCRQYGIEEKVLFLGRVPYGALPAYLNLIDVCLSTQTNDLVGQVRTTGKLPLYLACGRYILASAVGEAALILDEDMLVTYEGVKDEDYPRRLAERIREIVRARSKLQTGSTRRALALERFDYRVLAEKVRALVDEVIGETDRSPVARLGAKRGAR